MVRRPSLVYIREPEVRTGCLDATSRAPAILMTCCWCNGDHPSTGCPEKITIQEALNILGPIRAIRARQLDPDDEQMYWLDGKIVRCKPVKKAAIERKRKLQNDRAPQI